MSLHVMSRKNGGCKLMILRGNAPSHRRQVANEKDRVIPKGYGTSPADLKNLRYRLPFGLIAQFVIRTHTQYRRLCAMAHWSRDVAAENSIRDQTYTKFG
jgi:hypothetical protein